MLWQPDRHEPLTADAWDEARARAAIGQIVQMSESAFEDQGWWPAHPRDSKDPAPEYMLYSGAAGTIWSLTHLQARGAAALRHDYAPRVLELLEPNREAMGEYARDPFGSFLMGDTSIRMLRHAFAPGEGEGEIARLIESNMDDPTREYMWGSPGTLAAAFFMHERTGGKRWADLYRRTAEKLWSQLEGEEGCRFWSQDMYGHHTGYIDGVHGFAGTAAPLILGRHLLGDHWPRWQRVIADTIRGTAEVEGPYVNWRARMETPVGGPKLMQYCHGAPGFVICLGDFPGDALDDLLQKGAEATWAAGPLAKGSNLCHGTAGNGYVFLKLFRRTGNEEWLMRARAFAMHAIHQVEREVEVYGRGWFSLWTGHPGVAIYLLDCIEGRDRFPTVDFFFEGMEGG